MRNRHSSLLVLGLTLALARPGWTEQAPPPPAPPPTVEPGEPAPPPEAGHPEFQRGFEQGQPYGEKVGRKKGASQGRKEGDREGYAAGLKDAEHGISNPDDPGQPGGGEPPPPPPTVDPVEPPAPEPPPADEPPVEDPPADDPPADEPPAEDPPALEPPSDQDPAELPAEAAASMDADDFDPEAQALALYPDLVPRAAADSRLDKARQFLQDPQTQKSIEYSAGFAAGFGKGYAKTFDKARKQAYGEAFRKGYARGQADWKRRNTDADGNRLTPEGQYRMALSEFQRGNFQEAADRFDMVLAGGEAGELADKAMYGKARCLFMLKDYPSARKAAHLLVQSLPDSALADDATFLAIACLELHKKGGFLGFGRKADRKGAADEFETFLGRYADSPLAPRAAYRLGMLAASLRQKQRAIDAYQMLLQSWPDHPLAPKARRRLQALCPDC